VGQVFGLTVLPPLIVSELTFARGDRHGPASGILRPAPSNDRDPEVVGAMVPGKPAAPAASPLPPGGKRVWSASVADLVSAGLLPEGAVIDFPYKGQTFHAKVRDGCIDYAGALYDSPSPAGMAITGSSVNGWRVWQYHGRTLAELRGRLR
jgi:hypothetical protein